ncbi:DNA damage-binding protein 1 [Podosphaera aphanis]|nr:DNA damage-binding protein 1 [Podosphaera aphanis]
MSYLAPVYSPSSIRHAVKLNLIDSESSCLVVAKANKIEIWTETEKGLAARHSETVHGRISMLAKIRPVGAAVDHLFIGTSRFKYFTAAWNGTTQKLETIQSFEDQFNKHMRESQSRDGCLVDPTGQYVVLELFEGVINLVKVLKQKKGRGGYLDKAEQVRLTELKVRASTFLFTETKQPKLALLYTEGPRGDVRLATYRIVDDKGRYSSFNSKKDRENELGELEISASHLIPVPKGDRGQKRYMVRNSTVTKALLGGVIVVSEIMMTYLDDESKAVVKYHLEEPTVFVAWVQYDGLNYLLADAYTNLFVLTILVDGPEVTGMKMRKLGKTTKASQMILLRKGVLYIASHEGDSQVVSIDLEQEHTPIRVLQTITNIAPILDFTIMDMGGLKGENQFNEYSTGQARIFTGSGANECGSLRSVRSGVGLEDAFILADMQEIIGVFSLKSFNDPKVNLILLVALPIETRIFVFDAEEGIEEVNEFRALILDETTILAMNISVERILQITPSSVILLQSPLMTKVAEWRPPGSQRITSASANARHVLLSSNGINLVSLDISDGIREVTNQELQNGEQVACIHVPSQLAGIGVVGFWKSGSVSILNLQNLEILCSENIRGSNNSSIPRDVALVRILPEDNFNPVLFVATEDGVISTFNVDKGTYKLVGKKSIVLGTHQAKFHILPQKKKGLMNILATCNNPSLIYGSDGRIVYSAVTAQSAVCVCSFDLEANPDLILVATNDTLKISKIDTERRTHVQTLPMGMTVRRIAYSPKERALGLGCIKRKLIQDREVVTSSFSLVDDIHFKQIGKEFPFLRPEEIIECVIRAELTTTHSKCLRVERFIIGTSFLDDNSREDKGRMLIFGVDSSKSLHLVSSLTLKGACRQVAVLNNQIIVALVKTVVVYDYRETTTSSAEFTKLATYRCSTCPIDLTVHENIIAVADLQKSLVLLEYQKGDKEVPNKLVEIARHYQAAWATAVCHIEGNSYLQSDQDGNIIVLQRSSEGTTLNGGKRMEVTSEFHLGEMVNRMRPIHTKPTANAVILPKVFLATTEGSIFLFSLIKPTAQDLLLRLQNAIITHVPTLGDIDFNAYRSFCNMDREAAEPFRFVDGELIERFLDVDETLQAEICLGLGPSIEDIRDLVEELKRSH